MRLGLVEKSKAARDMIAALEQKSRRKLEAHEVSTSDYEDASAESEEESGCKLGENPKRVKT